MFVKLKLQKKSQGTKSNIPVIEPTTFTDRDGASKAIEIQSSIVEIATNENTKSSENLDCQTLCPIEDGNTTVDSKVDEINLSDDVRVLKQESECSDLMCLSSEEVDNEQILKNDQQPSQPPPADAIPENESVDNPSELMDKLLERCFLHALLNTKNTDLPILTSTFYKNYLLPCCPHGHTVDIKKSSYKKLTKFLQVMVNRRFITMKEQSKGVHTIDCINWNEDLRNFKKDNPGLFQENAQIDKELTTEDTKFKPPEIEEVLAVSGATQALFKYFGHSKGAIFSAKDIRQVVTDYVKAQELVSTKNKRIVLLNPILFSVVHKKGEGNIDSLPWDELFRRVIDRMNPCHRVTFTGQTPITRKGKLESIDIKVVQRMGNKKVTLVHNLEYYGIDPGEFAHKLQLKAASSTAVSQLPGKCNTGQQVLIQGNQVQHVATTLRDDYQIATKYIDGLDKLKQSGQKKK